MSTEMENQRATKQMARFVVMYDTPSDIEAFERHYREVHIPLAKQLPGLRRYTVSHDATPVIGEPYYLVAMLDWDDMESLGSALGSEAGNKTAEDVITNLSRYTTKSITPGCCATKARAAAKSQVRLESPRPPCTATSRPQTSSRR